MSDPRFASFAVLRDLPGDCFLVGGVVRDVLLGRAPKDVDVACSDARAAAAAFAASSGGTLVDLGRDRFTTYRVLTAQGEFDFSDLQGSLESDLARRDSTINAMAVALPSLGEVIDQHGGVRDLAQRLVRMVREQNFVDDPLRVLKMVRLAVTLDFDIEPATLQTMRRHGGALASVAGERTGEELVRIVESMRVGKGLALMSESGLDAVVLGGAIEGEQRRRIGRAQDAIVRWTLLTAESSDDELRAQADRLRWPGQRLRGVLAVRRLVHDLSGDRRAVTLSLHDAGRDTTHRIIEFLYIEGAVGLAEYLSAIVASTRTLFTAEAFLTGDEIMRVTGVAAGTVVGRLKRELLAAQLMGDVRDRDDAEAFVRERRAGS